MKPEDVPQHYVDLAMPAWTANTSSRPGNWSVEGQIRAVLAPVLTEVGTGMAVQAGLYRSAEEDVTELTTRLQQAEAALERVRALATSWRGTPYNLAANDILAELDQPARPPEQQGGIPNDATLVDTTTFHRLVQVAAHVSRGRQAADVGVYPDALARMALGALDDETLRAALPDDGTDSERGDGRG